MNRRTDHEARHAGDASRLGRFFRHRFWDEADVRRVLPAAALARLSARVTESELRHAGEIRVCVEASLPVSYLWRGLSARQRALALFGKLRVWDTEHNNGVLVYLLLAEHAIEIVADRGLNRRVSAAQWQAIVDGLRQRCAMAASRKVWWRRSARWRPCSPSTSRPKRARCRAMSCRTRSSCCRASGGRSPQALKGS